MDELNDVLTQRANLEKQLANLRKTEERLKLEKSALVSIDNQVFVIKQSSWYELQLRQKAMDGADHIDFCFPFIYSNSKEELEAEMLCLIQRLLDATIQLGQLEK